MIYDLLDSEGLYLGASSALNVVAAVELAEKLGKGTLYHYLDWGHIHLIIPSGRFKSGHNTV